MKKIIYVIITVLVIISLAACSNSKPQDDLSSEKILTDVYQKLKEPIENTYKLVTSKITSENAEYWLGLSSDEYSSVVEEASLKQYEVTAITHASIAVKLTNEAKPSDIFEKMKAKLALDKFGCLKPEKAIILQGGRYIFIVWGNADSSEYGYGADDLANAFREMVKVTSSYEMTH